MVGIQYRSAAHQQSASGEVANPLVAVSHRSGEAVDKAIDAADDEQNIATNRQGTAREVGHLC